MEWLYRSFLVTPDSGGGTSIPIVDDIIEGVTDPVQDVIEAITEGEIGGVIEDIQDPHSALNLAVDAFVPPDSELYDFLNAYNDVAFGVELAVQLHVPMAKELAAYLAQEGFGLFGTPGTWAGDGAAQGWSSSSTSGLGAVGAGAFSGITTYLFTEDLALAAGNAIGSAIGYAIGGPLGAVVGSLASSLLFDVFGEEPDLYTYPEQMMLSAETWLGVGMDHIINPNDPPEVQAEKLAANAAMYAFDAKVYSMMQAGEIDFGAGQSYTLMAGTHTWNYNKSLEENLEDRYNSMLNWLEDVRHVTYPEDILPQNYADWQLSSEANSIYHDISNYLSYEIYYQPEFTIDLNETGGLLSEDELKSNYWMNLNEPLIDVYNSMMSNAGINIQAITDASGVPGTSMINDIISNTEAFNTFTNDFFLYVDELQAGNSDAAFGSDALQMWNDALFEQYWDLVNSQVKPGSGSGDIEAAEAGNYVWGDTATDWGTHGVYRGIVTGLPDWIVNTPEFDDVWNWATRYVPEEELYSLTQSAWNWAMTQPPGSVDVMTEVYNVVKLAAEQAWANMTEEELNQSYYSWWTPPALPDNYTVVTPTTAVTSGILTVADGPLSIEEQESIWRQPHIFAQIGEADEVWKGMIAEYYPDLYNAMYGEYPAGYDPNNVTASPIVQSNTIDIYNLDAQQKELFISLDSGENASMFPDGIKSWLMMAFGITDLNTLNEMEWIIKDSIYA